jgi:hypothetical protein
LTENLDVKRVAAKFVPRLPTDEQKQKSLDVIQEFFDVANTDESFFFKKNIILLDETWVYSYDVKTEAQSSQCS